MTGPSLIAAGLGFRLGEDATLGAEAAIRGADRVFHIVGDPATEAWIAGLNPRSETLRLPGGEGETPRPEKYAQMMAPVRAALQAGERVCVATCGHPGVLSDPSHAAAILARDMGAEARVLPGIGAEGRMFADLGLDPGETGWQAWDATDFLIHGRRPDPTAALILFQPAMVGSHRYRVYDARGLSLLTERLADLHGEAHEVVVYEAAYDDGAPAIRRRALSALSPADLTADSLLFVPPSQAPRPDLKMMARLARIDADAQAETPE